MTRQQVRWPGGKSPKRDAPPTTTNTKTDTMLGGLITIQTAGATLNTMLVLPPEGVKDAPVGA
jgi:hypothetical protein